MSAVGGGDAEAAFCRRLDRILEAVSAVVFCNPDFFLLYNDNRLGIFPDVNNKSQTKPTTSSLSSLSDTSRSIEQSSTGKHDNRQQFPMVQIRRRRLSYQHWISLLLLAPLMVGVSFAQQEEHHHGVPHARVCWPSLSLASSS